jgi:hypothetical protein
MSPVLLLLASTWLDPQDPSLTDLAPQPSASHAARWLPRVTLRFTRRAAGAWWSDSRAESLTTPMGTTFELRLEWGGSDGPSIDP